MVSLSKLPHDIFVRIHRSYVVNRKKVDAVQKNKVNHSDHYVVADWKII